MEYEYEYEYNLEDVEPAKKHWLIKIIEEQASYKLAEQRALYDYEIKKPITNARYATFRWSCISVSNADRQNGNRDRLRIGELETTTQKLILIGFDTWIEFNNHIDITDKKLAKYYFEEITAETMLSSKEIGEFKLGFWCAKKETNTQPGWWAITLDEFKTNKRSMCIYSNGQIMFKEKLDIIKINQVKVF
jgi:hypothetical protein